MCLPIYVGADRLPRVDDAAFGGALLAARLGQQVGGDALLGQDVGGQVLALGETVVPARDHQVGAVGEDRLEGGVFLGDVVEAVDGLGPVLGLQDRDAVFPVVPCFATLFCKSSVCIL